MVLSGEQTLVKLWQGTVYDDVIYGLGGNDTIDGGSGAGYN